MIADLSESKLVTTSGTLRRQAGAFGPQDSPEVHPSDLGHISGLVPNDLGRSFSTRFELDDETAELSIDVLNLPSRTRQYLFFLDARTLRELVSKIPDETFEFRSQGTWLLWKEIKETLQSYLEAKASVSVEVQTQTPERYLPRKQKTDNSERSSVQPGITVSRKQLTDATRPLNVLNLPDYARDQLQRSGIRTVGELIDTLPKGPHGIGPHTWRHIQQCIDTYLAKPHDVAPTATHTEHVSHPPDSTSQLEMLPQDLEDCSITQLDLRAYALDCLQRAGITTLGGLWDLRNTGSAGSGIPGLGRRLWDEVQQTVVQYVAAQHANSPLEPADSESEILVTQNTTELGASASSLNQPIERLELSVRSYNCLKRAGIDTIGQVLAVLPEGRSAIRNAGTKTWSEIEDAVAEYVCTHDVETGMLQAESEASPTASPASLSCINTRIEVPELPEDIGEALRNRSAKTIQTLAVLPLFHLARISEISALTHEDWFSLMPIIKDCDVPERTRLTVKDAKVRPSLVVLGLSARPLNCLARAGILDLETLARCTLAELTNLRNFGAKSMEELFTAIHDALASGAITFDESILSTSQPEASTISTAEAPNDVPAPAAELQETGPKEPPQPEVLSLDERLDAWLAHLSERQRQVLQWRYALIDGEELTLEEIGERLNVTRERVRQIESKALRRLLGPTGQTAVRRLVAELHHAIVAEGGVMSETDLAETLASIAEIGENNPQGVVRLLLGSSEKYIKIKEMQAWCLPHLASLVSLVGIEAINVLRQALAPISTDELLQRLKQTQFYEEHRDDLNDKFILACVHADGKIVQREDGNLGLEVWDRHWQDNIVFALRTVGQPMHYAAIADVINASQQNDRHITPRAVHIRLMQHPEIFVWIGRRGTYGLREWGLERAQSYADALIQVLQAAGHPLTITEVLAALVKLRPYYGETSVQLTLGTNSRFRAFPGNTFGLAEWREEDFASDHYRIQRLFENSQVATTRSTKPDVLEAINGADSFIARIRENGDYAR